MADFDYICTYFLKVIREPEMNMEFEGKEEQPGQDTPGPSEEELAVLEGAQRLKEARKDIMAGTLWCVGGLLVTYLTYYFAKSGGTYTVAYGAVVYGAFQGLKGLWNYLREMKSQGRDDKFRKGLLLGLLSVVAVIGLGIGGWKFSHRYDYTPVDHPQVIACEPAGTTFTIPAGYAEAMSFESEETDSTYSQLSWFAADTVSTIFVETTVGCVPDSIHVVDALEGYFCERDANLVDGLLSGPDNLDLGSIRVRKSVVKDPDEDGQIVILYDILNRNSLISVSWGYEGPERISRLEARADDFIRNMQFR